MLEQLLRLVETREADELDGSADNSVQFDRKIKSWHIKRVLWNEKLAQVNSKYDFEQFVNKALQIKPDNINYELINRVLDVLDLIRAFNQDE